MQDRFRFRAWNFKENKYYQQNEKGMFKLGGELPNGTPVGVLCSVEDLTNNRNYGKNFVVEQCTGLKDKNGKLIYEGDILKSDSECFCEKYKVEFYQEYSQFILTGINTTGGAFGIIKPSSLKIIGNIHENPLEEK